MKRFWLAVVFAVAGCASATPTPDSGNAAGGTFPVTIEHFFGSTEIKQAPKRVVSLGYTDDQTMLALGTVPGDRR